MQIFLAIIGFLFVVCCQSGHEVFLSSENKGQFTNNGKEIIFVRHGSTDWSWQMLPEGVKDLPINNTGRLHIKKIAMFLAKDSSFVPEAIFCSPLLRCRQSAEIIQSQYQKVLGVKIPLFLAEDLKGPSYGEFDEKDKKEIFVEIANIEKMGFDNQKSKKLLLKKLEKFHPKHREPQDAFKKRTIKTIRSINNLKYSKIIVVSHGSLSEEYLRAFGKIKSLSISYLEVINRNPLRISFSNDKINWLPKLVEEIKVVG